ncbi:putative Late nodulin [Medicago truncatula]|uniref:Nodule Cysteine-Rich (NCR) secreted peptide n=1 Tax=Medicago truncatula TaxID=3880 RepID=G7JX80_MEDTR|nr:Nodule Cysteine-Rich (NCR) secreted peptide [Medicago truncatula]RHN55923.1 putative Late nodulin [Medicago truncatula]
MAKLMMFFYVMIYFFVLVACQKRRRSTECRNDSDCEKMVKCVLPRIARCIKYRCQCRNFLESFE